MTLRIDIITLFPDWVYSVVEQGVCRRAIDNAELVLKCWNPRDFTNDRHQSVDDRPYGGGPGMVMLYEPLKACVEAVKADSDIPAKVVYLSPQGRQLDQELVCEVAEQTVRVILVAGRYEGVDERFIETFIDEEWSIGDYVLSGGELAAMVVIDAVTRLLPGTLGDSESANQDSFMDGLLDYPHYTRPEVVDDQAVPPVLLGGNHAQIASWRRKQSLGRTWQRRPDLLAKVELSKDNRKLLDEFIAESGTPVATGFENEE